jgi:hypothetical protein
VEQQMVVQIMTIKRLYEKPLFWLSDKPRKRELSREVPPWRNC